MGWDICLVRSFHGMNIVSDLIISLAWEGFWKWLQHHGHAISNDILSCADKLRSELCQKVWCVESFQEMLTKSVDLQKEYDSYNEECCVKS